MAGGGLPSGRVSLRQLGDLVRLAWPDVTRVALNGTERVNAVFLLVLEGQTVVANRRMRPGDVLYTGVEANLVKNGMVIPVYYDPGWNGESIGVPKPVEGLTVQPFHELYRKLKGAPPSGQLWDVYLAMLAINSAMQRLLVLPPTTPQPALDALQAAVARLNSDKAFADDAQKTIGFVPEYVAGAQVNRQVRQALVVRPEIKAFVADYIKSANK